MSGIPLTATSVTLSSEIGRFSTSKENPLAKSLLIETDSFINDDLTKKANEIAKRILEESNKASGDPNPPDKFLKAYMYAKDEDLTIEQATQISLRVNEQLGASDTENYDATYRAIRRDGIGTAAAIEGLQKAASAEKMVFTSDSLHTLVSSLDADDFAAYNQSLEGKTLKYTAPALASESELLSVYDTLKEAGFRGRILVKKTLAELKNTEWLNDDQAIEATIDALRSVEGMSTVDATKRVVDVASNDLAMTVNYEPLKKRLTDVYQEAILNRSGSAAAARDTYDFSNYVGHSESASAKYTYETARASGQNTLKAADDVFTAITAYHGDVNKARDNLQGIYGILKDDRTEIGAGVYQAARRKGLSEMQSVMAATYVAHGKQNGESESGDQGLLARNGIGIVKRAGVKDEEAAHGVYRALRYTGQTVAQTEHHLQLGLESFGISEERAKKLVKEARERYGDLSLEQIEQEPGFKLNQLGYQSDASTEDYLGSA